MATEIRFAFALNGGVSLAIWIGGVVDEVLRFVDAGRVVARGEHDDANPYVALCRELDVVPKVDVLAGSSAGGLNAAFLAAAIVHGCNDLQPIKQLWFDRGSFDRLLRPPDDSALISLLNGDDKFLPYLEEAFKLLAKNGTGFVDVDPPVTVVLTATSLGGRVTTISDGHGAISSVDHRAEFTFRTADFDFDADGLAVKRLARACRSTASFPGAFEPSTIPVELYERRHVRGLFEGVTKPTIPVIDGAVLVNLPAQRTIEAIIRQPSRERIERVLALVVPDPTEPIQSEQALPKLSEVLVKGAVGIPRTQSLTEFVRDLNEHNLEVRSRRAARDAMLAQFADVDSTVAWGDFANVATALFPAYRATRLATSLERIRLGSPARRPLGAPMIDLAVVDSIDADVVPWVPNELALGGRDWCWGSAPIRRVAAVLITWINTVAAAADPETASALYAVKDKVSRVRADADRISPPASVFEKLFVEELRDGGESVAVAFERASRRWPADDPAASGETISALNEQLSALAGCLTEFLDVARSTIEPSSNDHALRALRGVLRLHDGTAASASDVARLLLSIEVIEATFAGTEPRPDQVIRVVQFTSKGTVTIDERERSAPIDKLSGVELAHFGAFLKRSWRANDWMWGRLDAAERLVTLLDATSGQRLTADGTRASYASAIQADILREELPTVVAEIENDVRLGAHASAEGKTFCDAVRAVTGTANGPVDLSAADEQQLRALFALQLVGAENLEKEIGSALATMTSIAALATTAGLLRAQGPRFLHRPIALLGAVSRFAWRIARRYRARRARLRDGALLFAIGLIGLVGTIIDLFTSVDLGAFRYVAWALLALTPALALLAVPWLILRHSRKLMGRRRPR